VQRNLAHKRKKKIRRLWEEYTDLRSADWSLGPRKVRKAQIRDEAEIPEEQRNVRVARSLLNEGVGGKPRPWTVFEIKDMQRARSRDSIFPAPKCPEAPFKEVDEDTYRRSPGLHSYYSRVYDYEKGAVKSGPTDTYSLLPEYLTGWTYLPPVIKPRFSPEAQEGRAEIKRRIVEISGMDFWTAVQVVNERSTRREPGYTRGRYLKREAIRTKASEKEVERARIGLLCERCGDHQYWENSSDSSDPEAIFAKPREDGLSGGENVEEYRREETTITIAEKLSDQG
jgi:hypothetical protein